jgi:hypothetical protein
MKEPFVLHIDFGSADKMFIISGILYPLSPADASNSNGFQQCCAEHGVSQAYFGG